MQTVKVLLTALLVAGCASANIVSIDGEIYTFRVKTTVGISSPAIVTESMQRKAVETCPEGWEKVGESVQTRKHQSPLLSPTVAVEWRIRCN